MMSPDPAGPATPDMDKSPGSTAAAGPDERKRPGTTSGTASDKASDAPAIADILIAGGGLVGLSLALALAKLAPDGLRITLVEGRPLETPAADARASALSAASRNLLTVLGIWPLIADKAQPMTAIEITDGPLDPTRPRPAFLGFDNALRTGQAGGEPGAYVLPNAPLLAALSAAVAREPAVEVIAPDQVVAYEADNFAVTSRLKSGRTLSARLLVAADGRRSALREQAGIAVIGWDYDQVGIVTTVAHDRPHGGKAVQHFLPSGPFALLPLPGNRTSIVWTEEKQEASRIMALDEQGFLRELEKRFGPQLGTLELAGPRQSFPLSLHIARAFVAKRFALIGDAAHGVHPLAGQGLNIGLRDVAALTEVLVEGARLGLDPGSAELLARYEQWRLFDSTLSALAMDAVNRLFSNDTAPLREMRDMGLRLVNRMPGLKRLLVREASGLAGTVPRLLEGKQI